MSLTQTPASSTNDREEDQPAAAGPRKAFVGVRQTQLTKMYAALSSTQKKEYEKLSKEWTDTRAPEDVMLR